jgi:hypothetical protein
LPYVESSLWKRRRFAPVVRQTINEQAINIGLLIVYIKNCMFDKTVVDIVT